MEHFEYKGFHVSRKMWRDRWAVSTYFPNVLTTTSHTYMTKEAAERGIDEKIAKGGKPASEIHNEYSHLHWGVMTMFDADVNKHIISEDLNQFIWRYMTLASKATDELLMSYENLAMMLAFWEILFPNQPIIEEIGK